VIFLLLGSSVDSLNILCNNDVTVSSGHEVMPENVISVEKKKSTSPRPDPKVLKDSKILAVENETSIQAIIESLV